jgi:uncharacterized protein (DUF1501 family)
MTLNRRTFLASTAALTVPSSFGVTWARAAVRADKTLVVVFLRGGMDALNFIAPADDKDYMAARPAALRVGLTGQQKGHPIGGLPGTGDLMLHPEAGALAALWRAGKLAVIPASGLVNGTRSHFQAMDLIERGIARDNGSTPRDGWLTRTAVAAGRHEPGSIISIGGAMPQSLSLCESALPASDVWDIAWVPSQSFREALFEVHKGPSAFAASGRQALEATGRLALKLERNDKHEPALRDPPKGVAYPDHNFGRNLGFLAEMLRIAPDIGIATADLDGWDTHDNQPDRFSNLVSTLSRSLEAFTAHLDAIGRDATIVVMSEFGRRIKANESRGTDHGQAGAMMVIGSGVGGGRNYGTWPGLATDRLDEGADLAVTTDFRDVLGSVLHGIGSGDAVAAAFPGYSPRIIDGLMRS